MKTFHQGVLHCQRKEDFPRDGVRICQDRTWLTLPRRSTASIFQCTSRYIVHKYRFFETPKRRKVDVNCEKDKRQPSTFELVHLRSMKCVLLYVSLLSIHATQRTLHRKDAPMSTNCQQYLHINSVMRSSLTAHYSHFDLSSYAATGAGAPPVAQAGGPK
jgi:hypothetical protein